MSMKEWIAFAVCLVGAIIISTSMANANETKTITLRNCSDGKELPSNVSNFVQNEWQETKEFQANLGQRQKNKTQKTGKRLNRFLQN